jgi:hypothetical protein
MKVMKEAMMPKGKRMKPQKSGGKIDQVKIGPKWTIIKIRLSTKRLRAQVD